MSIKGFATNLPAKLFLDNWPIRRRWLRIGMLALWANAELVLAIVLFYGADGAVVQVFLALLGAIMSIFMIYVFGAVWDDNNKRQHWAMFQKEPAPENEEDVLKTPSETKE